MRMLSSPCHASEGCIHQNFMYIYDVEFMAHLTRVPLGQVFGTPAFPQNLFAQGADFVRAAQMPCSRTPTYNQHT